MMKKLKNFCRLTRRSEGFTLVELVVVIAIVAILSGIAVPAYGAYVEKSQKAGDLQLLAAVNKAFAAAVFENGQSIDNVRNAELDMQPSGGAATYSARAAAKADDSFVIVGIVEESLVPKNGETLDRARINESFKKYYKDNLTSEFKAIKQLMFVKGVFVDPTTNPEGVVEVSYGGGSIYISEEDIAELNSSAFGEMGLETLLDKVDFATQVAITSTDPRMIAMLQGAENMQSLANVLGYTSASDPQFNEAMKALTTKRAEMLAIADGKTEADYAEYMPQAGKDILANNAVLTAATKSFDTNAFTKQLSSGTGKDTIKANIEKDPQTALSQAAFAYAMYTSYANNKGITVSDELLLDDVLNTLETKEFQEYIKEDKDGQVTADIKGYQSAMNMISSSSNDSDAVSNLLVNGFTDPALLKVLQQAMG